MAVWMQIIAFRKTNSLEKEKKQISTILDSENLGLKLKKLDDVQYFEFSFLDQEIKIYFDNPNFIQFSGTSGLFPAWFKFADKKNAELTDKVRKVLNQISEKYGIKELLYFSEWFFPLDEIRIGKETFEELLERIEKYPNLERKELFGLESNEYYAEKVKSC